MIDNVKIKITNKIKKQILKGLLPIATKGDSLVNGDMKDRARLLT